MPFIQFHLPEKEREREREREREMRVIISPPTLNHSSILVDLLFPGKSGKSEPLKTPDRKEIQQKVHLPMNIQTPEFLFISPSLNASLCQPDSLGQEWERKRFIGSDHSLIPSIALCFGASPSESSLLFPVYISFTAYSVTLKELHSWQPVLSYSVAVPCPRLFTFSTL